MFTRVYEGFREMILAHKHSWCVCERFWEASGRRVLSSGQNGWYCASYPALRNERWLAPPRPLMHFGWQVFNGLAAKELPSSSHG